MTDKSIDNAYQILSKSIASPSFRNPIKNFIDENCGSFIEIEENTFEQGGLFNEFTQLIDNLLEKILVENNITQEMFLLASKKGLSDEKTKKYFEQLISFSNYTYFKAMMTKRNYQIIKCVEEEMKKKGEAKFIPQITKEEEEKEIQSAIKMSLALEEEKRRIQAIEDEELKVYTNFNLIFLESH